MLRKRKSYCSIVSCINSLGTDQKDQYMFRCKDANRDEWIEAIEKYHPVNKGLGFLVCIQHFKDTDYSKNKTKRFGYTLKPNAVPSIFDVTNHTIKQPNPPNLPIPSNVPNSPNTFGATQIANFDIDDDESHVIIANDNIESAALLIDQLKTENMDLRVHYDMAIQKLERKVISLNDKIEEKTDTLNQSRSELAREKSKTAKLNEVIDKLRRERHINEGACPNKQELEEIIECLSNGRIGNDPYPESVRLFCMSIDYYSPRAYEFIRKKFNNNLPSKSTMQNWLVNSNIDASPGICTNSLEVVKDRANEMKKNGKELICCLIFDEMAIRKNIEYCQRTRSEVGHITYGPQLPVTLSSSALSSALLDCAEDLPEASQAIVFMLSGINDFFQIPIAYHFIQSLNSEYRSKLLLAIIEELSKHNIVIESVTFDGYASNVTMCELLGARFKDDLKPSFVNPFTGNEIHIMLDPSHAEKLVRTNLKNLGTIYDGENGKIEWRYFEELVKYSHNSTYGLTHKITMRHVDFENRKMHVRTAVELLSNSVANSMEYLMKKGVPQFKGAGPTIKFVQIFDKLFDVMNTNRIKSGNVFKSALNPTNKDEVFAFLETAKEYILSLKVRGKNSRRLSLLVESRVKTGFRGYVCNIITVMKLYSKFVELHKMPFLGTYRLSQDHIEMLFGRIRSMHGCNDNPTVAQLIAALRRLLFKCDVLISSSSNVAMFGCSSNVLTVTSRRPKLHDDFGGYVATTANQSNSDDEEASVLVDLERNAHITELTNDAGIIFVANRIEDRVVKCDNVSCQLCQLVIIENEKVDVKLCVTAGKRPCKSTFKLCKLADNAIKTLSHCSSQSNFKQKIYLHVLSNIDLNSLYPLYYFDEDHDEDHKNYIVKHVIDEYVRIKCTYIARMKTLSMHPKYVRNRKLKSIHNLGQ